MDLRFVEMMRYARVPFELNVRPGDRVLIVTDTRVDPLVWQALAAACREVGGDPTLMIMTPRDLSGHEPPPEVAEAMKASTLNCLAASRSLAHTKARTEAARAGAAQMWMDGLTPEILMEGATAEQYREMQALAERLHRLWDEGETVRVTSPLGMDLTATIRDRLSFYITGTLVPHPLSGFMRCGFPDGECGIAPVEGTCNGMAVFDSSMDGLGALEEPLRFTVEQSRVVHIAGGRQARQLQDLLRQHGDENSLYFPAEISIGLNPALRFVGKPRMDKKARGGVHMAIGNNLMDGGVVDSRTHLDAIARNCSLWIDGRLVVEHGEIRA
ncbi:MAG: aminopeptidase [Armatimonadetes bacterium]|nr:aminopeptidase [Armatimonadota bacterium]